MDPIRSVAQFIEILANLSFLQWRIGFFVKRNIARFPDRPTFGCDGLDINLGIITSAQRIAEVDPVRALKGGVPKWEK